MENPEISPEVWWLILQIGLPLLLPAAILLVVGGWMAGKLSQIRLGAYFPSDGLGYFTMTFIVGVAIALFDEDKLFGTVGIVYAVLFIFTLVFIGAEVKAKVDAIGKDRDSAEWRRHHQVIGVITIASIVTAILFIGDLAK